MSRPIGMRWLALSGAALVMGVALSWLTYVRSEAVLEVTRPLIDRDLPALRAIAELKGRASDTEMIAYDYYSSSNRERFDKHVTEASQRIAVRMRELRAGITDAEGRAQIDALEKLQRESDRLFAVLRRELDSDQVNIGEVTAILRQISGVSTELGNRLDVLVSGVQSQAEERGEATQARLRDIFELVALFSILLVVATGITSYFLGAYLREAQARRRLALFPERNPNPVISLNEDGTLAYANPGALAMVAALGLASPMALLPSDLPSQLNEMRQGGSERLRREYAVGARIIGISIHRLEDSGTFHVYLADVTEREQAQAQLEFQAFHDVLTRLPNRRRFEDMLGEAMSAGPAGAVLLLALDRLQTVIDTLGHAVADRLLLSVAERLAPIADGDQPACCIYHFDGELFAALLPKISTTGNAASFAECVARDMAAPFVIDGREMFFSFSVGLAHFPEDGATVGELLRNADTALQAAKRAGGRIAVRYATAMNARALERLEVEHELRRVVERGELELHYQPQLEIGGGRIIGVEALVRWRHPARGMVSPAEFIPLAEETGVINEIGTWVLETACAQNRQWQETGLPPMIMAVNIAPRQFANPELPKTVLHALRASGLEAQWLELEVTEGAAMHDVDATIATLHAFKAIGVRLSIDDFGTGYSSLAYLKRFPIDKLKVDQSFVRNMTEDANDAAIARSVIALGHSLGLTVIAEGVETDAHLRLLEEYGCDEYQGYLFSRPKPAAELRALLDAGHAPIAPAGKAG